MSRLEKGYFVGTGLQDVLPAPVEAGQAPTSSDIKFPLGQVWLDTVNGLSYILAKKASGSATWNAMAPGASDVDTISGDSGGNRPPSAGNIVIAGGTNITTAGASSTITVNLDAAITLATSVTSPLFVASTSVSAPLYTAGAGVDLDITVPAGQDAVIKMGDASAANKVSFTDTGDVEVAQINSDGAAQFDSSVTAGGDIIMSAVATKLQMNGGAVTDFIGQATLTSGTVTVANTNIAANDRIILTRADANSSSALGELTITAQTASTSFVITALDPADGSTTITGDTSIVNYFIVRQN